MTDSYFDPTPDEWVQIQKVMSRDHPLDEYVQEALGKDGPFVIQVRREVEWPKWADPDIPLRLRWPKGKTMFVREEYCVTSHHGHQLILYPYMYGDDRDEVGFEWRPAESMREFASRYTVTALGTEWEQVSATKYKETEHGQVRDSERSYVNSITPMEVAKR